MSDGEANTLTLPALAARLDATEAVVRRQAARMAQYEDAVSFYGPPTKKRHLNIPEMTREQRNTIVIFLMLVFIPALIARIGKPHDPPAF